ALRFAIRFLCALHPIGRFGQGPRHRPDRLRMPFAPGDAVVEVADVAVGPRQRLLTLPGVGLTLAVVIALEVGDVARFASAEKLAAYAGTTPRVHASGGKTRFGPPRPDVPRRRQMTFAASTNAHLR